jgi:hypothetical protein
MIALPGGPEVVVDPSPDQLRALRSIGPVSGLLHPPTGRVFAWLAEAALPHHVETRLFLAGAEPTGGTPPSWWGDRHPDDTVYVSLDLSKRPVARLREALSHPAVRRLG